MRSLAACALLSLWAGTALAQTPAGPKGTPPNPEPPAQSQAAMHDAAEIQIELLNRQNALLAQILSQNQHGLVTYPVALALPGPIACRGNCTATVADICRTVKYPNAVAYPATVPADTIGVYANGVCYGP